MGTAWFTGDARGTTSVPAGEPLPAVEPATAVPASLTEAALQLAAYWYVSREAATDMRLTAVPFGVLELIAPYRESVTGHVAA